MLGLHLNDFSFDTYKLFTCFISDVELQSASKLHES